MSIDQYSTTPSSNDLSNYFKTGMRPSAVKTAGWDVMADLASYVVSLPSAGGTANALTVANGRPFGALVVGLFQALNPTAVNTGPATFAPDGLGATSIFANGAALLGGELQPNVPALLKYDGTRWNLANPVPPPANARNFIVDPSCRIARNATAPVATTAKYGQADLTKAVVSNGTVSAGTIQQGVSGFTPNTGSAPKTQFSAGVSGLTVSGASATISLSRYIEAYDAQALVGRTVTFSALMWQTTGITQTCQLVINAASAFNNFSSVSTVITGPSVNVPSGAATLVTATGTVSSGNNGLSVTAITSCPNASAANVFATDWGATLSSGYTQWQEKSFQEDLADASRLFDTSYDYGVVPGTATTDGSTYITSPTTGQIYYTVKHGALKINPSGAFTIYSPNSGLSGKVYNASTAADVNAGGTVGGTGSLVFQIPGAVSGDLYTAHWILDMRF